jgi:hypothetical protein
MKIMRNLKAGFGLDSVMKDKTNEPGLDENDPVWRLLAESPRPEPDAWFAVRTMARCRNAGLGSGLGLDSINFRTIWRWALGGGLGVCLAVFLLVPHNQPSTTAAASSQPQGQQQDVQDAFAYMASMDAQDASSSSTTTQDSSL